MTVTEFLEARIAEDEAAALPFRNDMGETKQWRCDDVGGAVRYVGPRPFGLPDLLVKFDIHAEAAHVARWDPARVLAECTAKRAVIEAALDDANSIDLELACCHSVEKLRANLCPVFAPGPVAIRALAAVYKDHPDYDKEWAL